MRFKNITQLRLARKNGEIADDDVASVNEWCIDNGYEPLWGDYPLARSKSGVIR